MTLRPLLDPLAVYCPVIHLRVVFEPREVAQKSHLNFACLAVTLFGDHYLRPSAKPARAQVFGTIAVPVNALPVNEHHYVRVLLYGAGFAKVGELRLALLSLLDSPRELRKRDDRDIEFFGEGLQ